MSVTPGDYSGSGSGPDRCRRDADRQSRRSVAAGARRAGAGADLIAAEDTRHTGAMLRQLGIDRPLISLHDHNETRRDCRSCSGGLRAGRPLALVERCRHAADLGPGLRAGARGDRCRFAVHAVPGPSAMLAALASQRAAGRPVLLRGFPARPAARRGASACARWRASPARWCSTSRRIGSSTRCRTSSEEFGRQRHAAVARELTKMHESDISRHARRAAAISGARTRISPAARSRWWSPDIRRRRGCTGRCVRRAARCSCSLPSCRRRAPRRWSRS